MRSLCLIIVCLSLTVACGAKKDPVMQQAGQVHKQAIAIHEEVMVQINDARQLIQRLKVKRETSDSTTRIAIDSTIARIEHADRSMNTWMDEVVEVPGLEDDHAHTHGEGHDHDHSAAPEITPQQMLEIQKEMKVNIEKIQADLIRQMERGQKLLGNS